MSRFPASPSPVSPASPSPAVGRRGRALGLGLVLAAALPAAAWADDDGPQWTVTVDPLTVALGYPHLQVERALGDAFSLYAGPHARLFDGLLTETPEPFVGFGVETGLRWFPWGEAPEGAWLMGRTVVAHLHTTEGPAAAELGGYASLLAGYTGIIGDVFVLSGGLGYNQLYYDINGMGASGPFIAAHTNLGVAF